MFKKLFLPGNARADYADAGDFLRVACVLLIGWYHIWQQSWLNPDLHIFGATLRLYPIVACGYMFVDLMLLLSGFLLMLGYLSGRGRKLRSFYVARAGRILPSYLFCMAVMLLIALLVPGSGYGSGAHLRTDLLAHLSFTHNLFPESYSFTKLNGALWTLAVEVQFYLIFPFLARAFERDSACSYAGMAALGVLSRIAIAIFAKDTSLYINRLSAMLDVYANGMLAAMIFHRLQQRPQRAWQAWLSTLLTLLSAALIYAILNRQLGSSGDGLRLGQLFWRFPLSALGSVFLVCGSRSIYGLRRLMSNRIVRFLSGISFNFYIWHQFLAVQLKKWRIPAYSGDMPNRDGQQPWQSRYTLLCFLAALLAAALLTYLLEKPCAKWIKRSLSSRKEA